MIANRLFIRHLESARSSDKAAIIAVLMLWFHFFKTVIYIETNEDAIAPNVTQPKSQPEDEDEEEAPVTRGLPSVRETQK